MLINCLQIYDFAHYFETGKNKAISPVNVFDAGSVLDAYRYMQQGVHMGKILVKRPSHPSELQTSVTYSAVSFSDEDYWEANHRPYCRRERSE